MSQPSPSSPAEMVFAVDEHRPPRLKRLVTAVASMVIAVVTLGAGTTPVVGSRVVIRRISTGDVVADIAASATSDLDTAALVRTDLGRLTAAEFAERWIGDTGSGDTASGDTGRGTPHR